MFIYKLFIYFFFFLSFFFEFSFLLFSFIPIFSVLTFCLSSSTLYHLSMCVLVMSIDSNFVFEFIAWAMVIMLVHSICQKWIHVRPWLALCRTWVNDFQRHVWHRDSSVQGIDFKFRPAAFRRQCMWCMSGYGAGHSLFGPLL